MPWFRHHYYCEGCDGNWLAEAELAIETEVTTEADCPFCRARGVFPYKSQDLTLIVAPSQKQATRPRSKRRAKVPRPSRAA